MPDIIYHRYAKNASAKRIKTGTISRAKASMIANFWNKLK